MKTACYLCVTALFVTITCIASDAASMRPGSRPPVGPPPGSSSGASSSVTTPSNPNYHLNTTRPGSAAAPTGIAGSPSNAATGLVPGSKPTTPTVQPSAPKHLIGDPPVPSSLTDLTVYSVTTPGASRRIGSRPLVTKPITNPKHLIGDPPPYYTSTDVGSDSMVAHAGETKSVDLGEKIYPAPDIPGWVDSIHHTVGFEQTTGAYKGETRMVRYDKTYGGVETWKQWWLPPTSVEVGGGTVTKTMPVDATPTGSSPPRTVLNTLSSKDFTIPTPQGFSHATIVTPEPLDPGIVAGVGLPGVSGAGETLPTLQVSYTWERIGDGPVTLTSLNTRLLVQMFLPDFADLEVCRAAQYWLQYTFRKSSLGDIEALVRQHETQHVIDDVRIAERLSQQLYALVGKSADSVGDLTYTIESAVAQAIDDMLVAGAAFHSTKEGLPLQFKAL